MGVRVKRQGVHTMEPGNRPGTSVDSGGRYEHPRTYKYLRVLPSFILNVAYWLILLEGPRCHSAKACSADCCFRGSFFLGSLPYTLASETG